MSDNTRFSQLTQNDVNITTSPNSISICCFLFLFGIFLRWATETDVTLTFHAWSKSCLHIGTSSKFAYQGNFQISLHVCWYLWNWLVVLQFVGYFWTWDFGGLKWSKLPPKSLFLRGGRSPLAVALFMSDLHLKKNPKAFGWLWQLKTTPEQWQPLRSGWIFGRFFLRKMLKRTLWKASFNLVAFNSAAAAFWWSWSTTLSNIRNLGWSHGMAIAIKELVPLDLFLFPLAFVGSQTSSCSEKSKKTQLAKWLKAGSMCLFTLAFSLWNLEPKKAKRPGVPSVLKSWQMKTNEI